MIYATYQNRKFKSQIEYIFDLIFTLYRIDYQIIDYSCLSTLRPNFSSVIISYGKQRPKSTFKHHIHIYESEFFGKNYLKLESMPKAPLKRYGDLPVIYYGHGNFDGFVRKSKNLIETNIDIIASSFFILSRYEEVVLDKKDRFDRFPATESLAYKEGFLNRPIVNEYIDLLWSWIDSFELGFKRKNSWGDKDFVVCLTHDVDSMQKHKWYRPPLRGVGSYLLKHRKAKEAGELTLSYLKSIFGHDPHNTFDYMLSLEKKYTCNSTFFLMSINKRTDFDNGYWHKTKQLKGVIDKINEHGCEIGLHPSYESCNDGDMLRLEKNRLEEAIERKVYGCRQHYLRFEVPTTWEIQEKAGFLYDTTLSFADYDGFRCGICLPFKPYDLLENRVLNLWEIPLIVMEGTLQNPDYRGLSPDEGFETIRHHIETIKRHKGVFVFLWHNSSFDPLGGWQGWDKVYEKSMELFYQENALISGGKDILQYFESSNSGGNYQNR